jgi:hypothetical protein
MLTAVQYRVQTNLLRPAGDEGKDADAVVDLKAAFARFDMDLDAYRSQFPNFMDISKVPETEQAQVAVAWLSSEFSAMGEEMPDEQVILIDEVSEKEIYKQYCDDDRIADLGVAKVSYVTFTKLWREVFPKVRKGTRPTTSLIGPVNQDNTPADGAELQVLRFASFEIRLPEINEDGPGDMAINE